ncbi:CHRD domain-containing protein [Rubrivirga sp.]|uniref:CHRD domain-containing protein n=1 Tax=Rubrivirga sp. TaxID=1885344 RepID=UPI003B51CA80
MRLRVSLLALLALVLAPTAVAQDAFINEFHYDNASTDEGEFVEIAVPDGTDVADLVLTLYNGNGGSEYGTFAGTSFMAGAEAGDVTLYTVDTPGIQNGGPDGLALSTTGGTVLQFLSYEGSFAANNGPAMGIMSTDIGVSEDPAPAAGQSLQLTGDGEEYEDFTWTGPATATRGQVNNGQTFEEGGGGGDDDNVFTTLLLGANEVPPVETEARGGATLTLDGTTLTVTGVFDRLSGDYQAAHLHGGAPGQNGPVRYGLTAAVRPGNRTGTFEAAANTFEVRETFADSIRAGLVYVNVHSSEFPMGEIRGQVGMATDTFSFTLRGDHEVPPVMTPAMGSGTATLDGSTLTVTGTFTGLTGNYRASHVHAGAIGQNGPVVQGLSPTVNTDNRSGTFGAGSNTYELRPTFADSVRAGLAYVNIHSDTFPAGEIRGQIGVDEDSVDTAVEGPADGGLTLAVANPVRGRATVAFTRSAPGPVDLALFDVLGRRVATLADGPASAEATATLDASGLSAGVYVLRLQTEGGALSRTLTVVR